MLYMPSALMLRYFTSEKWETMEYVNHCRSMYSTICANFFMAIPVLEVYADLFYTRIQLCTLYTVQYTVHSLARDCYCEIKVTPKYFL